ncbi:purine-nucleoside phosphorylase [Salinactinospora qingdaonensis]|uniref:Purine nucleoside phosphorylase n=1 Tax=Salinactinospora qingdaonensis TaxID=702744 RepID=A0ABP7EUZ0_9ACTN
MPPTADETARRAAAALRERTGADSYDSAVVLGSGWAPAADALAATGEEIPFDELPGFVPPGVEGHRGHVRHAVAAGGHTLVFLGRTHLYEGHTPETVVHGVRTAVAAGASTVILTNAAGALRPDLAVGQPVLISDHLNLTARSPLVGPAFVDLSDTYAATLRARAREADPTLAEGIYAAMPGPHFETPAEIRMLRAMGADLVGMSTVLEAIAARAAGAQVLGLSLVTNPAAGVTDAPVDAADIMAAGRSAAPEVGRLLASILARR